MYPNGQQQPGQFQPGMAQPNSGLPQLRPLGAAPMGGQRAPTLGLGQPQSQPQAPMTGGLRPLAPLRPLGQPNQPGQPGQLGQLPQPGLGQPQAGLQQQPTLAPLGSGGRAANGGLAPLPTLAPLGTPRTGTTGSGIPSLRPLAPLAPLGTSSTTSGQNQGLVSNNPNSVNALSAQMGSLSVSNNAGTTNTGLPSLAPLGRPTQPSSQPQNAMSGMGGMPAPAPLNRFSPVQNTAPATHQLQSNPSFNAPQLQPNRPSLPVQNTGLGHSTQHSSQQPPQQSSQQPGGLHPLRALQPLQPLQKPGQPQQTQTHQMPSMSSMPSQHTQPQPPQPMMNQPLMNNSLGSNQGLAPPTPSLPTISTVAGYHAPLVPPHVIPCPPSLMSVCYGAMPSTRLLRTRVIMPQGVVLKPFGNPQPGEPAIPLVDYAGKKIVRCRFCHAYISCFAQFIDGGNSWRCNFCMRTNETAGGYYAPLDNSGVRVDVAERPELTCGAYEILATADYMVRNPMPPCFFFLIDVSAAAQRNGMTQAAARAILSALGTDNPEGDSPARNARTKVGFATYDSTVHLYEFSPTGGVPRMHVIPDMEDLYLPAEGLLANLEEHRKSIESFLTSLSTPGSMFSSSTETEAVVSAALTLASEVVHRVGGKISLFVSSMDSIGGTNRQPSRERAGSEIDSEILKPASNNFQTRAIAFTRFQISVDVYAFARHDGMSLDLASMNDLAKYTGGQTCYYPTADGTALHADVFRALSRSQGWESVVRMRCTQGVSVSDMYGHFALRGNDLIVLPSVDCDKALTLELNVDESGAPLASRSICVQGALLYTSSDGVRRIRVYTLCLPVVHSAQEIFSTANPSTTMNLLSKQMVPIAVYQGLSRARELILTRVASILMAYRSTIPGPTNTLDFGPLSSLPMLALGISKSAAFRVGNFTSVDLHATMLSKILIMASAETDALAKPKVMAVYPLTGASASAGLIQNGNVVLPPETPLTVQALVPGTVYLADNGVQMVLRLPSNAGPQLYADLFTGGPDDANTPSNVLQLLRPSGQAPGDATSAAGRINAIIDTLRAATPFYQSVLVIREGEPMEKEFFSMLIDDAQGNTMSLQDYINFICVRGQA